jgi:hypothetical protein
MATVIQYGGVMAFTHKWIPMVSIFSSSSKHFTCKELVKVHQLSQGLLFHGMKHN